jgi:hypothetical protein
MKLVVNQSRRIKVEKRSWQMVGSVFFLV